MSGLPVPSSSSNFGRGGRSARGAEFALLQSKHLWWAVTLARIMGPKRLQPYEAQLAPAKK